MKTRSKVLMFAAAAMTMLPNIASAQLHVGGYGEAAYSRNFYSDHVSRYSLADEHKDDPSHGRFDIPHAVVYLSYDFGKDETGSIKHFSPHACSFFKEE
jgi:hypothetical protein